MRPPGLPAPDRFLHGTRSRYVSGCRCTECRAANTAAYHERQRRAKEAATELAAAPVVPIAQTWTAPDGTMRERMYRRACPGVDGAPCPLRAHLRKDSTGAVCGACRERLVWNGLVDARRARRHLRALSRKGVGYKSVADAADVGHTVLAEVLAGRKRQIRRQTEKRVLEVTTEAIADHALVPAAGVWRLLDRLLEEGFTKTELARRLGYAGPALQIGRKRVLARTAHRLERFYREIMTDATPRVHRLARSGKRTAA